MENKLIVILGPTSSGKTDLSIKLAKKFNGEVISADSRQVYKRMDIGTGKVTKKEMQGIPHYLLDVANPKTRFTVAQYQKLALKAIKNIQNLPAQAGKNKIPFLVGGTGFYIQSVVDGIIIPKVKPDWKLREKLSKIALPELFKRLKALDPARAAIIDQNNPRRVIRALEIVMKLNRPVPTLSPKESQFNTLILGVKKDQDELKILIHKRLIKRLKQGMIDEVKKLKKTGVSWKRLEEFGLEYRYIAYFLQNKINYNQMIERLQKEIEHYAKRQMTWFKREPPSPTGFGEPSKRIHWIKDYKEAERLINNFIKK